MTLTIVKVRSPMRGISKIGRLQPKGQDHCGFTVSSALSDPQDAKGNDMIRIGIIGLGWWGKQIVMCLADSPRFKVVAGCDIDIKMAAPFAAAHKFDLTDDYKTLLTRPGVDAIAVVTPHALHEEMAIAAFAAGKQVFCEKPLALTTASAERILAACAKAKGVLGIGHERRYEPAMEEMRRLFESGELGRLLHMDANVSHSNFRKMDPAICSCRWPARRSASPRTRPRKFSRPRRRISSARESISPTARAGASLVCRRRRFTGASRLWATMAGLKCS